MISYQMEYAAWANQRVLAATQDLTSDELTHDFKTSDRSIQATLTHIYRADRIWLARMEGESVSFSVPGDDTMQALLENWPPLSERWIAWAKGADANGELVYKDLRGNSWKQPVWQVVHHVVNHATHHRGQVVGFLRALGRTPPNVDSISFAREVQGA